MNERLEYVQQLEAQIETVTNQLEALKAEKDNAVMAAQHEEVENLEKYLDEANISLKGLTAASDEAWHTLREDVERLLSNLRVTVDKLLNK